MFCLIYRWMISWALDSGKSLPRWVNHHMRHCEDCREFSRVSRDLTARLVREAPGFTRESHDSLKEKIIANLNEKSPAGLSPRYPQHSLNFRLLPAFAAVILVGVIVIGIAFRVIPLAPTKTTGSAFTGLPESRVIKMPLQGLANGVESPIETEMHSLGQSLSAATEFLVSCLDINIGQK